MSVRTESASGLIWNTQKEQILLGSGIKKKLVHVRVRSLPQNGHFIEELAAACPEVGALTVELDESDARGTAVADLSGLEALENLEFLSAAPHGEVVVSERIEVSDLRLRRLSTGYFPGMTENLVGAPRLNALEVDGSTIDILLDVRADLRELTLFRTRKSDCPAAWNEVSGLQELNIDQAGAFKAYPPENGWPPSVSIRWANSVRGLVEASQTRPFQHLYLNGVRLLDAGSSLWDLRAESIFIDFEDKPPKWLVEAWPHRPADWSERFKVAYHPSLPDSEDSFN